MRRLALALAFLMIAGACTSISSYRYRGIETPHTDCATCHQTDVIPALVAPVNQLCVQCHSDRATVEHAVDIAPKSTLPKSARKLPLYDGKLQCATCHDPHGAAGHIRLLRLAPSALCTACHDK